MKRFDELERYLKSAELVDGVSEQDREEILEAVRRIRALPRIGERKTVEKLDPGLLQSLLDGGAHASGLRRPAPSRRAAWLGAHQPHR
jgi:hypothetical protein